ncbi:MAG: hypothetical protein GYB67_10950, partial [Chloroflexi bacterium]|nr:hypothetical protein [Chloroflexota bacterium]
FTEASDAFYNGGGPGWMLPQLRALVDGLTTTPDLVLLGVDQMWFNDHYAGDPAAFGYADEPTDFANVFLVNRSFTQTILDGEAIDLAAMLERREPGAGGLALGFRAIRDGHGFRNDGSEQYGDFLIAGWLWPPAERQRHLDWLRAGAEMYAPNDTVSAEGLRDLAALLAALADRGSHVIGFLTPLMPTIHDQLMADARHSYLHAVPGAVAPLFAEHGFPFHDFTDAAVVGGVDEDFFDGWHGSERMAAYVYLALLAAHPDLLGGYSDAERLRAQTDSAADTFWVFSSPP